MTRLPSSVRYPTRPGPRDWREPWQEPDRTEPMASPVRDYGPPRWREWREQDPREAAVALLVVALIVFLCSVYWPVPA